MLKTLGPREMLPEKKMSTVWPFKSDASWSGLGDYAWRCQAWIELRPRTFRFSP